MFIVSLIYKADLPEIEQHMADHINYLNQCYKDGHFILSGPKQPRTGGIILAQASSRSELNNLLEQDPFFKTGVASFSVEEFIPTRAAEGLEKLL